MEHREIISHKETIIEKLIVDEIGEGNQTGQWIAIQSAIEDIGGYGDRIA